ncbi:hypothetical protein [Methanopyrus sp.]
MEVRAALITAVIVVLLMLSSVWQEAPELGKHTTYFDLTVQSLKVYLVEKYGLERADWDPFSYLGRPPFINYPIIPFLISSYIGKILHTNPFLTTIISDIIFWAIPILAWIILQALKLNTRESTLVILAYILCLEVYLISEAFLIRVATSLSTTLLVLTVMMWNSKLNKILKKILCTTTLFIAMCSNFVYGIPAVILLILFESYIFAIPLLSTIPILLFTSESGKFLFDNFPLSAWMISTPSELFSDMIPIIWALSILTILSIIKIEENPLPKLFALILVIIICLIPIVFISPKLYKLTLNVIKLFSQIDLRRLTVSAALMLTVVVPKAFKDVSKSLSLYSLLFIIPSTVWLTTNVVFISPLLSKYTHVRISEYSLSRFSVSSPIDTKDCYPTHILGGGFYQGCNEISLRIISSVLYPANTQAVCEPLMHPAQHTIFSEETAKKVANFLPVYKIDFNPSIQNLFGYSDVNNVNFKVKPKVKLNDVIEVNKFKSLYVGSYTDYSFLWINLIKNLKYNDKIPLIPIIRAYNVHNNQSLKPTDLPWTREVIIVDPTSINDKITINLIKMSKKVILVYSYECFDKVPLNKAVQKIVRLTGKRPEVVGPITEPISYRKIKDILRYSLVNYRISKGSVKKIKNDEYYIVRSRSKFVIVPWSWAPFWAVNGREGLTCPVGPYMLVKTDGKPVILHYVAWENHQRKVYELSFLALAALTAAIVIPEILRMRDTNAEGR